MLHKQLVIRKDGENTHTHKKKKNFDNSAFSNNFDNCNNLSESFNYENSNRFDNFFKYTSQPNHKAPLKLVFINLVRFVPAQVAENEGKANKEDRRSLYNMNSACYDRDQACFVIFCLMQEIHTLGFAKEIMLLKIKADVVNT